MSRVTVSCIVVSVRTIVISHLIVSHITFFNWVNMLDWHTRIGNYVDGKTGVVCSLEGKFITIGCGRNWVRSDGRYHHGSGKFVLNIWEGSYVVLPGEEDVIDVIIGDIERFVVPVMEGDSIRPVLFVGEFEDHVDNRRRDTRHRSPAPAHQQLSGGEAEEFIRALHVSSWSKANGGMGSTLHGVRRDGFVMYLTVGSKFNLAVEFGVELSAGDDFTRAVFLRNTAFDRK